MCFPHGSIDDSEVYALEDLGREAVKSIFTTMVKSISNVNNNMQIRQYIDVQGINEVRIHITGIQRNEEAEELVESAAFGDFDTIAGKYYLKYEELSEEGGITKTIIRISDHTIEVMKHGDAESKMIFCPGKLTETDYATPYGNLSMSLNTSLASYELTEEGICARIEYTLSLNGSFVSVNQLNIEALFC